MSLLLALAGAEPAPVEVVHAKQPRERRKLKWRQYERLDEPEQQEAREAGPNLLAEAAATDVAFRALVDASNRLAAKLSAARIEQENARRRADAAKIAKEIVLARRAMSEMVLAARLSESIAQEIEELDVAYITAMTIHD